MAAKSIYKPEYQVLLKLLHEMRGDAGLDQDELAFLLRRPQSYISAVEGGSRRLDLLQLREYCMACGHDLVNFVRRFEETIAAASDRPLS
ncbi:DNA-binding protein [Xanthomonas citri pv. mangiferaeindicae LMG 941]|uniref:helix-turn-helix domain-containing protein n=1 Tax=Xanthomonas citri TaxID=346 RepID=UPI0002552977|nr:helix-turn-helix transcriptional regulator [Xanthomonas citri]CCG37612.1 DNA-binding protein [Xanthomonas citri pv. mangiferaeindicae LMG 941]